MRLPSQHGYRIRGYTLVELMIVISMLMILAAIVVPRMGNATQQTRDTATLDQLRVLRGQINMYRTTHGGDPNLIDDQWAPLVDNDLLTNTPVNPMNGHSTIAAAAAANVGWVWRDKGNGTLHLYATNADADGEFVEAP